MTHDVKIYTLKVLEQEMNFTIANKLHVEYQLSLPMDHRLTDFKDIDEQEMYDTMTEFSQHIYNIKKCIKQIDEIPTIDIGPKN